MSYPGNYGYFPNTLAGDGDPLDVIVLTDYSLQPGTLINCKIIGVLITSDEKGLDEKIIAVPSKSVDNSYCNINDISNVSSITLDKINHFFRNYKILKKNKWVETICYKDSNYAQMLYDRSKINIKKLKSSL